ncbi:unnamed protein product [Sympodiomycopsis kandeliae]
MYRYYIDIHGQMFLYDTVPKNLTSAFKDARFLNFFYDRIKPIDFGDKSVTYPPNPPSDWHENESYLSDPTWSKEQALSLALSQDYRWISECQGEWNFIQIAPYGTPIVFRELNDNGQLTWAGDRTFGLSVEKLKVCSQSGYLYHPSPLPHTSKWQKATDAQRQETPSPYGRYSLLSSSLVLSQFSEGLEVDPDLFHRGQGGSVQWRGDKYDIGVLKEGDLATD